MRLSVRHVTEYRYDGPGRSLVQVLRLAPGPHEGQRVRHWRVAADHGQALQPFTDGYGNLSHLLTLHRPHQGLRITVEGEVETDDTAGVVRGAAETLPPAFFLRTTAQTAPDDALRALAADAAREAGGTLARLHALMGLVHGRVAYRLGMTGAATTAAEALAGGSGVCQDHAHVMLAAARLMGVPARYVGGYLWPGVDGREETASHAWAEAWVEGLGWVGFDAANGLCPTDRYVRAAVGLDYGDAAPVRGVRHGAGRETLTVAVRVDDAVQGRSRPDAAGQQQ
ncbi:MAG TPA: transglutaminase family protein [Azospirillaceae bacterium]|nr:transglutaminase family protein [Azospirillaceae bacterium]